MFPGLPNAHTTTHAAVPPLPLPLAAAVAATVRRSRRRRHGPRSEAPRVRGVPRHGTRDTGTNLTAAACEALLGANFVLDGMEATLQSNPGRFYDRLGVAVAAQRMRIVIPDHLKVAAWCYRQAAEVYNNPESMTALALCFFSGDGVQEVDAKQGVVWLQKAADLREPSAGCILGNLYSSGFPAGGVVRDAARAFDLYSHSVDQGNLVAPYYVAKCYLRGEGVAKDAAHGATLLRKRATSSRGSPDSTRQVLHDR